MERKTIEVNPIWDFPIWQIKTHFDKKFNEKKSLYTCHGLVGNIEKRNTELEKLVDLHIKYTKQFEHTLNNQ